MAQHDYEILNQSGKSFRDDLNAALSAIASNNSGATAPSFTTSSAYQLYANTTSGNMQILNAAKTAWIDLFELDGGGIFLTGAARIKGDFTNATLANRAYLQSSTTNGSSFIGAIPNGTNNTSSFYTYNSSTPAAAAYGGVAIDGTYVYLRSSRNGAGLTRPLVIQTGDTPTTRMTFDANSYDITIPSTARIKGDFSNATVASRTCFKTSTANDYTYIQALPSGTAQQSAFIAYNNSFESTSNSQFISMLATDIGAFIYSGIEGTGSAFPISFMVDGTTYAQVNTIGIDLLSFNLLGDFTNATLAYRSYLQTNVTNGTTTVGALPNGTATTSALYAFNNSDPTDARYCGVAMDTTAGYLRCSRAGSTSTALPLAIQTGATPTTRIQVNADGTTYFPGVGTTASSPNAFLSSTSSPVNQLLRQSSSLRYKTNIESLDHARADSILDLRPVWYRSKAEADRKDWSWYGFIAEEVAAIEPRLVHWTYLEDAYEEIDGERKLKADAEMVPDGVQYDRVAVLLLDVVQRQQKKIEDLEARLTAAGI